jgi:phosphonopyruvate decarboxylase
MIDPKVFFDAMTERGVGYYAGVPDSLLASFCAYVDDHGGSEKHLITANEGNAIALAMGYYLATGKVAVVYMQNSGIGNAINPLSSLADPDVYSVPMLLIVGWRGEPSTKDEPQHVKQGRITIEQLNVLEIPHWVIDAKTDMAQTLDLAFAEMVRRAGPVALVVRKNTFSDYHPQKTRIEKSTLSREAALEQLLKLCTSDDLIVSTTGKTSREVFELRAQAGQPQQDFLSVGGMGHTSSIALGVAIGRPDKRVVCLDGDGSLLMHMGAMPVIANFKPIRFVHILLNNESHESVGGQATSAGVVDFELLAKAVGYVGSAVASDITSLHIAWKQLANATGPVLLEIKIRNGSRDNLGRPTTTVDQNKRSFMIAANAR